VASDSKRDQQLRAIAGGCNSAPARVVLLVRLQQGSELSLMIDI